jgi:hypothetical protein
MYGSNVEISKKFAILKSTGVQRDISTGAVERAEVPNACF